MNTKKFVIATVTWFCAWIILTRGLTFLFPGVSDAVGILFLLFSMMISYPVSTFVTNLLTRRRQTHVIHTGLSAVEGSLTSASVGLPWKTTVRYKHAAKSPEVTVYRENGVYIGYVIDFGNGIVGCIHGRQIIRGANKNLSVKITEPDGIESSANWK